MYYLEQYVYVTVKFLLEFLFLSVKLLRGKFSLMTLSMPSRLVDIKSTVKKMKNTDVNSNMCTQ